MEDTRPDDVTHNVDIVALGGGLPACIMEGLCEPAGRVPGSPDVDYGPGIDGKVVRLLEVLSSEVVEISHKRVVDIRVVEVHPSAEIDMEARRLKYAQDKIIEDDPANSIQVGGFEKRVINVVFERA